MDREQTPGIAGLGLGLTVVKGLCDVLSGAVAVESAPGRGSRFQVTLPYRTA
ncbi:MAG: ATP-binding protein [bacterium]|nr:ATP-binding protein [bacterium]